MRIVTSGRFLLGYLLAMVALFAASVTFLSSFDPVWMIGSMLGVAFIGLCAIAVVNWLVEMTGR